MRGKARHTGGRGESVTKLLILSVQLADALAGEREALTHQRISELRAQNQQLRDALAHGQLREARLSAESR